MWKNTEKRESLEFTRNCGRKKTRSVARNLNIGGEEEFINIKIWLHNKTVNRLNIIDFIIFNNLFYPKYLY